MSTSITPSDAQPPTAPGSLAANGALTSASLTWAASTDNVGVVRYNVYRSTTSGFTPSVANRIAQPTGTSYTDSGLAARHLLLQGHGRGRRGQPLGAVERGERAGRRLDPALGARNAERERRRSGKATLSWGAATDNVGVVRYNVHRGTSSGFTPSAANRIAQPTGTSYTDTGLAAGTYFYKVTAEDAAGNVGPASNEASATATADTTPPTAPANLAASVAGGTVNLSWTASTDDVGSRPLRRVPRHDRRVHALDREPDRAAHRDDLQRHEHLRPGHLLLQGDRRGRGREPLDRLERGLGGDRRHDSAERPDRPGRERVRNLGLAHLDRRDGQRRRRPLQRAPLDHLRLHAERREPDRPADGRRATPTPASPRAPTSTR